MTTGKLITVLLAAGCATATTNQSNPTERVAPPGPSRSAQSHVHLRDVDWWSSAQYPEELRRVYRYKALIGGNRPAVVPQNDVLMGVLELAPGAIYPGHKHPAPEIYYVMSGTAQWTVGDDTFRAEPGTAVYTPPNTLHRMVNTGSEVLRTVYFWWAPNGDGQVLNVGSQLLEPVPKQPAGAKFPN